MDLLTIINTEIDHVINKAREYIKKARTHTEANYATLLYFENEEPEEEQIDDIISTLNDFQSYHRKRKVPPVVEKIASTIQDALEEIKLNPESLYIFIITEGAIFLDAVITFILVRRMVEVFELDRRKVFGIIRASLYIAILSGILTAILSGRFINYLKGKMVIKFLQKGASNHSYRGVWTILKNVMGANILKHVLQLSICIHLIATVTEFDIKTVAIKFWKEVLIPEKKLLILLGLKTILNTISITLLMKTTFKVGEGDIKGIKSMIII